MSKIFLIFLFFQSFCWSSEDKTRNLYERDDFEGWAWRKTLQFKIFLEEKETKFDFTNLHKSMQPNIEKRVKVLSGTKDKDANVAAIRLSFITNQREIPLPFFERYLFESGSFKGSNNWFIFNPKEENKIGIYTPQNYPESLQEIERIEKRRFDCLLSKTCIGKKVFPTQFLSSEFEGIELRFTEVQKTSKEFDKRKEHFTRASKDSEKKIIFYFENALSKLPYYWDFRLSQDIRNLKDVLLNDVIVELLNLNQFNKEEFLHDFLYKYIASMHFLSIPTIEEKIIKKFFWNLHIESMASSAIGNNSLKHPILSQVEERILKPYIKSAIDQYVQERLEVIKKLLSYLEPVKPKGIEFMTSREGEEKKEDFSPGAQPLEESVNIEAFLHDSILQLQKIIDEIRKKTQPLQQLYDSNPLRLIMDNYSTLKIKNFLQLLDELEGCLKANSLPIGLLCTLYQKLEEVGLEQFEEEWLNKLSSEINQLSSEEPIVGLILHLHSRWDICGRCAPSLTRELERKDGFMNKLRSIVLASAGRSNIFFKLVTSCGTVLTEKSRSERFKDQYSDDSNHINDLIDPNYAFFQTLLSNQEGEEAESYSQEQISSEESGPEAVINTTW